MWGIKLQNTSLSLSLFSPGFKKEFSLEGTPTGFPKASNKYPRPKSVLESQVWPLRVKIISVDKTNLWFDWTGILSSGMSVTSPSVHTQSRRVHIKPAKSEEDNRGKKKKNHFPGSPSTPGSEENSHLSILWSIQQKLSYFFFSCVSKVGDVDTNSTVWGSVRPTARRMKSDNSSKMANKSRRTTWNCAWAAQTPTMWMRKLQKGFLIMKATRAPLTLKWATRGWVSTSRIRFVNLLPHLPWQGKGFTIIGV